jgi:hypothetical protein
MDRLTERERPEWLDPLLDHAREDEASDAEMRELHARVAAAVGAAPVGGEPSTGASSRAAGSARAAKKLLVGAGLGAVLGALAVVWWMRSEPSAGRPKESPAASAPGAPATASGSGRDLKAETRSGGSADEGRDGPSAAGGASATSPGEAASAPNDPTTGEADDHRQADVQAAPPAGSRALQRATPKKAESDGRRSQREPAMTETELLDAARDALRARPGRALKLARRHERRFSGGLLVQERELIAIEALLKLGRGEVARKRSARFRSRFAGSAHVHHLETLLSRYGEGG